MTIVLLETIHPDAVALLAAHDQVVLAETPADLGTRIPYAEIVAILTRGRGQIRRPLLEACPHLRVVARCGVGLDNIDVAVAQARGIAVERAPGSTTIAVAEHTLLLLLGLARRLEQLAGAVRAGNWAVRNHYEGHDLYGKTLGIIGMGDIGQRVATHSHQVELGPRGEVLEHLPQLGVLRGGLSRPVRSLKIAENVDLSRLVRRDLREELAHLPQRPGHIAEIIQLGQSVDFPEHVGGVMRGPANNDGRSRVSNPAEIERVAHRALLDDHACLLTGLLKSGPGTLCCRHAQ